MKHLIWRESPDTEFEQFHNSFRPLRRGRVIFSSRRRLITEDGNGKERIFRSHTYVKPVVPGIVKGKLARKAAKKARMAALRAAQADK